MIFRTKTCGSWWQSTDSCPAVTGAAQFVEKAGTNSEVPTTPFSILRVRGMAAAEGGNPRVTNPKLLMASVGNVNLGM
jgi:hypothetical protein